MTDEMNLSVSRRNLLVGGVVATAAGLNATSLAATPRINKPAIVWPSQAVRGNEIHSPQSAIVQTSYGKVRGFTQGNTYIFKGVPFAATTAGANRFRPPQPAQPWIEPRLAFAYGPISPQQPWSNDNPLMRMVAWADDRYQSEDCLNLNVWSPTLERSARLPVLVWLHGGGFTGGSSRENPGYEGLNLSRRGAVVVTVNHRLGPLGFMNLSEAGDDFESSGNAGMLDIVAALRWVGENIERFGGDPSRVTIFGQSGGGAKVSTLMAMPAARGLFHRSVVMSGSPRVATQEESRKLAADTATAAGTTVNDITALQSLDVRELLIAARAVQQAGVGVGWQPTLHPVDLPVDWSTRAPQQSADIPLIIGSVRDEFRPLAPVRQMSNEELLMDLRERVGNDATEVVASMRSTFPNATPYDLAAIAGGMSWRNNAVMQAQKQARIGAPVYHYYYVLPSPLLDGGLGVPHGADVDMFFDNAEKQPALTGHRPEAFDLAELMSGQLLAFAATGVPSYGPVHWEPFDPERTNTMMFDAHSRMENDPAGEARRILAGQVPV